MPVAVAVVPRQEAIPPQIYMPPVTTTTKSACHGQQLSHK